MNYAGLRLQQVQPLDALRALSRVSRRALVLASAVAIAFFVSGGIFTFTPLIGIRIAHTSGISMEPAHKQGDVVLIKDVQPADLHIGDVIVFEALGQKIMHRIVEERASQDGELIIVTQGDNVAQPDFPIRASQVSGKLVAEVPLLGSISRLLDADGGFYVYRSVVLTLAVTAVAVWGLKTSAQRRAARQAAGEEDTPETAS